MGCHTKNPPACGRCPVVAQRSSSPSSHLPSSQLPDSCRQGPHGVQTTKCLWYSNHPAPQQRPCLAHTGSGFEGIAHRQSQQRCGSSFTKQNAHLALLTITLLGNSCSWGKIIGDTLVLNLQSSSNLWEGTMNLRVKNCPKLPKEKCIHIATQA